MVLRITLVTIAILIGQVNGLALRGERDLQIISDVPSESPTFEPTPAPSSGPTFSPTLLDCAGLNSQVGIITRIQRQKRCVNTGRCEWSGHLTGECFEITQCSDYIQFSNAAHSENKCVSSSLGCAFIDGDCVVLPPSVSPTDEPTASPAVFSCEDLSTQGKCNSGDNCEWSGVGQCLTITACDDYNGFTNVNHRRNKCRASGLNCGFSSGVCYDVVPTVYPTPSPTFSPTITDCEALSVSTEFPRNGRQNRCERGDNCEWSGEGRGECNTITACEDYNKFTNELHRENKCEGSDLSCAYNTTSVSCFESEA